MHLYFSIVIPAVPLLPQAIAIIVAGLAAAGLIKENNRRKAEQAQLIDPFTRPPAGLGNVADQLTEAFINAPDFDPNNTTPARVPVPTIAPTPRKENEEVKFPGTFIPDWDIDPAKQRVPVKPAEQVRRRIPTTIEFENGFDPRVQDPPDKISWTNGFNPPVDYTPQPTQTVYLPPAERRFADVIQPPVHSDSPVHKICAFTTENGTYEDLLAEGQELYEAQSIGLIREDREDYQLEDSMALLIAEPVLDADGNATINTSMVYGHDAIAHLLFAPVAQAKSASFPKATFGLTEKIQYKTCNRIVKINNEIPPTEPKRQGGSSECCEPEIKLDECFIPVRNFKSNEPVGQGYKDQLQIIFVDSAKKLEKELTIPAPKDIVDAKLINLLLQPHLDNGGIYFGLIKCEFDMLPYGYLRYYASSKQEGEAFLRSMADLSKHAIKPKSFRSSDRPGRTNDVGLFKPDRAYVMEFNNNGSSPSCQRIDLT